MTVMMGTPHTSETKPLAIIAVSLGAGFGVLWTLFVAGEVASDPGGLVGVGLAALIVCPILALAALAWWRPSWAAPTLTTLVGLWVAASAVSVFFASQWQAFEDTHGPVDLMLLLVLCTPLAVLGWSRSRLAGVLLLVATATPLVTGLASLAVGAGLGGMSALMIVGLPFVAAGVLLVVVGAKDSRAGQGPAPG